MYRYIGTNVRNVGTEARTFQLFQYLKNTMFSILKYYKGSQEQKFMMN